MSCEGAFRSCGQYHSLSAVISLRAQAFQLLQSIFAVCFIVIFLPSGGCAAEAAELPDSLTPHHAIAIDSHVRALEQRGVEPLRFVVDTLIDHDLIIFDDGLHTAADPFKFYERLVRSEEFQRLAPYVFLEVIPMNRQPAIDAYLQSDDGRAELLYPAFQHDFGWPLKSYFDLFRAIWEVNRNLQEDRKIKVVAVSTPTLWREIDDAQDYSLWLDKEWIARDYFMYGLIRESLDGFSSGRKGVFLTNTRHAYRNLKNSEGARFRSTASFFDEWHAGKSFVIRFHSPALAVLRKRDIEGEVRTGAGMEEYDFGWARIADGLWDEAYDAFGGKQVAIPLADTPFGDAPYIGNLMLAAAPGQSMKDVNDAIIFLGPLEGLRKSAIVSAIYTPEFRKELKRRYQVTRTRKQLTEEMHAAGVRSVEALIARTHVDEPERPLPEVISLPPKDVWRR